MVLAPVISRSWSRSRYSPLFWLLNTAVNLAVGLALLLGDPRRVSGAGFISVREYGGPLVWGGALLAVGVLIAVGPLLGTRPLGGALGAAGAVWVLLAAGFVIAARNTVDAPLTGPFVYLFVAAAHGLHAGHYLRAR